MVSRRMVLVALAALVGVGAAAAGVFLVGADEGRAPVTGGSVASEPLSGPEIRFGGADVTTGTAVGLNKLQGRPVVVTVWASWCNACRAQAEPLRRFVGGKDHVSVLAIDTQEDAEDARAFLAAHDLSIPTVADEDGHIAAKLGVRELPTTIFLTRDHRVARMWEGPAGLARLKAGARAARDG